MKLYNTLSRQVEELQLLNPPRVAVYTCGPTVYDYAHVGHWFNYIRMDTLIRVLKANGFSPKWVMNITDVGHLVSDADEGEDKLEKGAKREGKTAWEVAEFYTQDFLDGMKQLHITDPEVMPKATDHITEQIELIQKLEEKGYTYIINDGVYYDTSKFQGYDRFAQLDLDDQQEGARVTVNPEKRNASDFALWKFSPKDHNRDMEWDSPWGKGFPGWHIECSAMSMKYLGETLDIHTGGIDHIPVHHTNEIAQSEAASGKRFANYWMHSNHVMVNGEKISKSLGNGIRLQDIVAKSIPVDAVRLHVLESHYRSQSTFSWDSLEAARNRLRNYQAAADLRFQDDPDAGLLGDDYFENLQKQIIDAVSNDLHTPQALALIDEAFDHIETYGRGLHTQHLESFNDFLQFLSDLLGINLLASADISDDQKNIVAEREKARQASDWASSDKLRDQLKEQGIALRDTPTGAIWYRL